MLSIKRVVVGISGGVDSAVTALLLKKRGYDVQGVFMKNWDITDETGICSSDKDYEDAGEVCSKIGIPLRQVNFVKEYWTEVFSDLINDYQNGYTPNPDILCNRNIKFNHFYNYAVKELNADAIATGHYARSSFGSYLEHFKENTDVKLLQAKDTNKDQTFFLSQIKQNALRKTMFPLGNYTKSEVKNIAQVNNMYSVAKKKESMGICFIGSRNFQNFITEYIEDKPGDFIDIETGKIVGKHNGIHQWTLGQRTRLEGFLAPYFVTRKDVNTNNIYVSMGTLHPALHHQTFYTLKPHWISPGGITSALCNDRIFRCKFIFQHTHLPTPCTIFQKSNKNSQFNSSRENSDLILENSNLNLENSSLENSTFTENSDDNSSNLIVRLDNPVRAITEGQYAVFYSLTNGECLGGAKISKLGPSQYMLNWRKYFDSGALSGVASTVTYAPRKTKRKTVRRLLKVNL